MQDDNLIPSKLTQHVTTLTHWTGMKFRFCDASANYPPLRLSPPVNALKIGRAVVPLAL